MSAGSWINSGISAAGNLARRIPWQVWLAAAGLLLAAFWLAQHDARIRRQAQLQQLKQQTSAQVAALKRQAARDVKQANVANARTIQKLEARRQRMEQRNQQLAAQLAALRQRARVQAEQVATLPIRDVETRVAAQLGLQAEDVVSGRQSADIAKNATSKPAGETTPHPAAGAATLSPRRGPDHASFADIAKNATSVPAAGDVALALSDSGARKVETALVELNACQAESRIENRQAGSMKARADADDAVIRRQAGSIASLNRALEAKDKILGRQASVCKAELRAARGTFLGRLAHVTEHIAIGVAVGLAVGVVVR